MFQPLYADLGISTIPCSTDAKKPLVRNYLQMGVPASNQLAQRFTAANAIGIVCGEHNRITVLDIDSSDPGVLKEAIARHSEPRVIAKTASGKYHGYFRFNGEGRHIRPWKDLPIDILGGGFILAPPSLFGPGEYHFLEGQIDDLKRLTPITGLEDIEREHALRTGAPQTKAGTRNNWLWRHCMREARHCDSLESLIDVARTRNEECEPLLPEKEVMKIAASAWDYTQSNKNHYGHHGAWVPVEEAIRMMTDPDALALLVYLRSTQGPWARFTILNALSDRFGWDRRRLSKARGLLVEQGYIRCVRPAYTGHAALYQWDD